MNYQPTMVAGGANGPNYYNSSNMSQQSIDLVGTSDATLEYLLDELSNDLDDEVIHKTIEEYKSYAEPQRAFIENRIKVNRSWILGNMTQLSSQNNAIRIKESVNNKLGDTCDAKSTILSSSIPSISVIPNQSTEESNKISRAIHKCVTAVTGTPDKVAMDIYNMDMYKEEAGASVMFYFMDNDEISFEMLPLDRCWVDWRFYKAKKMRFIGYLTSLTLGEIVSTYYPDKVVYDDGTEEERSLERTEQMKALLDKYDNKLNTSVILEVWRTKKALIIRHDELKIVIAKGRNPDFKIDGAVPVTNNLTFQTYLKLDYRYNAFTSPMLPITVMSVSNELIGLFSQKTVVENLIGLQNLLNELMKAQKDDYIFAAGTRNIVKTVGGQVLSAKEKKEYTTARNGQTLFLKEGVIFEQFTGQFQPETLGRYIESIEKKIEESAGIYDAFKGESVKGDSGVKTQVVIGRNEKRLAKHTIAKNNWFIDHVEMIYQFLKANGSKAYLSRLLSSQGAADLIEMLTDNGLEDGEPVRFALGEDISNDIVAKRDLYSKLAEQGFISPDDQIDKIDAFEEPDIVKKNLRKYKTREMVYETELPGFIKQSIAVKGKIDYDYIDDLVMGKESIGGEIPTEQNPTEVVPPTEEVQAPQGQNDIASILGGM